MTGSDRPRDPSGTGSKILDFPRIETVAQPPEPDQAGSELIRAWAEELAGLAEEEPTEPADLVLRPEPGKLLVAHLDELGLKGLLVVHTFPDRVRIRVDRPTVLRLVVWQALELRVSFRLDFSE